jgi:membrane protease YdiL (CAAX protease family)
VGSAEGDRRPDDEPAGAENTGLGAGGAAADGSSAGSANGHVTPVDPPWGAPVWSPAPRGDDPTAPGPAGQHPAAFEAPVGAPAGYADPRTQAAGPPPPAPYPPYPQAPYPPAPHPPAAHPTPGGFAWVAAVPPPRTHRWGLGAYVLVEAVFLGVSALLGFFVIGTAPPSAGTLALALAVPTVLAAATALLITVVRGNGPKIDLGLQWSWRDVGVGLVYGVGGLVVTIPASILYVTIVGADATTAVGDVFGEIRTGPLLAVGIMLILVFVAPLCEEIVYRGLLWGGVERLGGRWWAFGVSTLLFALAHLEFLRTPLLLVVAIPIALARLHTGRLPASIVAHQVNNLLPGVVLMFTLLGHMPTV